MSVLRVVFAGTPQFAVPTLEALAGSRHTVVGVLTRPDRPKGRGRAVAQSPIKQFAVSHGIPVAQPETLKAADGAAALREWKPDLLVVVAYGLILPKAVLELPRLGCINVHASLLPRWRGAAPIQRALLAGDAATGVTIMQMDAGLDTGPMLMQRSAPIGEHDTSATLHDRLATLGAGALLESVDALQGGVLPPQPQPEEGATYAPRIGKAEALIDWSHDARSIGRRIRAFQPWPIAETRLDGEQLRIHAAATVGDAEATAGEPAEREAAHGEAGAQAGTLIEVTDAGLVVQCGAGRLALTKLQRAGRRVVSAREFANATPIAGRRLG